MRLYYIANARMPSERAHGIQLVKMCEALSAAGVNLTLVVPARETDRASLREFYGLRRDVPVVRLLVLDFYRFGQLGFILGSLSFMASYLFYFLLKRVRGEQFVLYTTDLDQFSWSVIPLVGVPYFAEIHDAKRFGFLFYLFFKRARGIIVINRAIKEKTTIRFRLSSEKIMVFPNGIDLSFFDRGMPQQEARRKLHLPPNERLVVYPGRFYRWKGFDVLWEVAMRIPPGTLLLLVGEDEASLSRQFGRPLPSQLLPVGPRPFVEMPWWFAAADVVVVLGTRRSEYSYFHTSPMKLFECMAAGVPVVAADTPAVREIVGEEEVTFYEPDNAVDLARKIAAVLSDPKNSHHKAQQARQYVAQFSWDRRARKILEFINEKL